MLRPNRLRRPPPSLTSALRFSNSPKASTPKSVNAASPSQAVRNNAQPLPVRSSAIQRSSSSMMRWPASTLTRKSESLAASSALWRAAPPYSSRTASPRHATPIRSPSSSPAASLNSVPTTNSSPATATTPASSRSSASRKSSPSQHNYASQREALVDSVISCETTAGTNRSSRVRSSLGRTLPASGSRATTTHASRTLRTKAITSRNCSADS